MIGGHSAGPAADHPALIAFLPAGFPDPHRFQQACEACVRAGADVLEIGMAEQAPEFEGEVVRAAFERAASASSWQARLDCLALATAIAPVIGMSHAADTAQATSFLAACEQAGVGDALFPRLSVTAQLGCVGVRGVGVGVFVSTRDEFGEVARSDWQPSFVYVRSSPRSTGQPLDAERAAERIADVRAALAASQVPVFVGFGVEHADQVAEFSRLGVAGIVVGTAVVRAAGEGPAAVDALVSSLAAGIAQAAA